jgi:hypothetical protein
MTQGKVADYLGITTLRHHAPKLSPVERRDFAGLQFTLYSERDVKRFAKARFKDRHTDPRPEAPPRVKTFMDPDALLRWALEKGMEPARALELSNRRRRANEQHSKIRVGTGAPRKDDVRRVLLRAAGEVLEEFPDLTLSELAGFLAAGPAWQDCPGWLPAEWASPSDPGELNPFFREAAIDRVRGLLGHDLRKLLQNARR